MCSCEPMAKMYKATQSLVMDSFGSSDSINGVASLCRTTCFLAFSSKVRDSEAANELTALNTEQHISGFGGRGIVDARRGDPEDMFEGYWARIAEPLLSDAWASVLGLVAIYSGEAAGQYSCSAETLKNSTSLRYYRTVMFRVENEWGEGRAGAGCPRPTAG